MPAKLNINKLLALSDVQAIMLMWKGKTKEWIRYRDLREKLVKGKKVVYRGDRRYFDIQTADKLSERPKPIFQQDSLLARRLKELVVAGILDKKREDKKISYRISGDSIHLLLEKINFLRLLHNYSLSNINYFSWATLFGINNNWVEKEIVREEMKNIEKNICSIKEEMVKIRIKIITEKIKEILPKNIPHSVAEIEAKDHVAAYLLGSTIGRVIGEGLAFGLGAAQFPTLREIYNSVDIHEDGSDIDNQEEPEIEPEINIEELKKLKKKWKKREKLEKKYKNVIDKYSQEIKKLFKSLDKEFPHECLIGLSIPPASLHTFKNCI